MTQSGNSALAKELLREKKALQRRLLAGSKFEAFKAGTDHPPAKQSVQRLTSATMAWH
jgi:hypothetical protein